MSAAEPAFRCSRVSLESGEPIAATASTVTRWLLLEQPGPWGEHALLRSRLPDGVGRRLRDRAREHGVRALLLRRPGSPSGGPRHCFLARTDRERTWLAHRSLERPENVLDVDLAAVALGEPPSQAEVTSDPLFLVCTNGRRDPCCAERGRAVARTLGPAFDSRVWECSHIGGDRFAANLACFPHGLYFGRVTPEDVVSVASRYAAGHISLEHYRGRSGMPPVAQAAEHAVRLDGARTAIDDVRVLGWTVDGPRTQVAVAVPGREVRVTVRRSLASPRRLTCHAAGDARPPAFDILAID